MHFTLNLVVVGGGRAETSHNTTRKQGCLTTHLVFPCVLAPPAAPNAETGRSLGPDCVYTFKARMRHIDIETPGGLGPVTSIVVRAGGIAGSAGKRVSDRHGRKREMARGRELLSQAIEKKKNWRMSDLDSSLVGR